MPTKKGYLFVGQLDKPFAKITYTKALKEMDNKIIECKYEYNQWKFMRERTDKSFPNSYETAMGTNERRPSEHFIDTIRFSGVCGSILTPVTKEMLLSFIREKRYNDDAELMQPPRKRARV